MQAWHYPVPQILSYIKNVPNILHLNIDQWLKVDCEAKSLGYCQSLI